ncbi:efflux RND transporter periplasmic adaptor subunit [Polaromonas sp. YR568]|uniref:efflux RND transporter periplasmic adaptor subunit n=1 Tax=Polaromonas sp. YR568 TaxID=1855301 RepID=UPI0031381750
MNLPKLSPVALATTAAVLLVAGVAVYFITRPAAPDASKAAAVKPALTVTTTVPETASLPVRLSANGNITAWQEAIIGSESNGLRLVKVMANVGDKVKAGQVLAVFSADSVQTEVAQARANLAEAEANAADAIANNARARTLENSGALSAQQIAQYATAEQSAKARVEAARAALDAQQLRGRQTQVLAPDNGVISAREATLGAVVGAGTELFRMIRGGRLEWRAEVTSYEVGRIKPGMVAQVTAASGAQIKGRVRMIAPSVDPQTRTALVYVDLPASAGLTPPTKAAEGAPGMALAGMFARGEFDLGATPALTIPQQALVIRDGFNYVFRVNPNNQVSQIKVQTGRLSGQRVEITSGLDANARLVASGAGFLNDGDVVRVNDTPPPTTAPATPAAPAPASVASAPAAAK